MFCLNFGVLNARQEFPHSQTRNLSVLDPWTAQFVRANGQIKTHVPLDDPGLLQFLITA